MQTMNRFIGAVNRLPVIYAHLSGRKRKPAEGGMAKYMVEVKFLMNFRDVSDLTKINWVFE